MMDFFAIKTPDGALKLATKAGAIAQHPTHQNIERAKRMLKKVVAYFEDNKALFLNRKPDEKPVFHDVARDLLFNVFKGTIDGFNLLRVCEYIGIKLTDEVRSTIIGAYLKSFFPNIDMRDIEIVAAGRKSTNGKITAEEYKQWADRALMTGYPSPSWSEALEIATKMKDEADRAPYARKMLRENIMVIRKYADVIKRLNVSTSTYIDILETYMKDGDEGIQKAIDVENALELGADMLGKALQKAYPALLFEQEEEQSNDQQSKVSGTKLRGWSFTMPQLRWRKLTKEEEATVSAEATAPQATEKAAA